MKDFYTDEVARSCGVPTRAAYDAVTSFSWAKDVGRVYPGGPFPTITDYVNRQVDIACEYIHEEIKDMARAARALSERRFREIRAAYGLAAS